MVRQQQSGLGAPMRVAGERILLLNYFNSEVRKADKPLVVSGGICFVTRFAKEDLIAPSGKKTVIRVTYNTKTEPVGFSHNLAESVGRKRCERRHGYL